MRDYIYLGSIVFVIIVFLVVVFLQNLKIKKLMNRYEAFMNGKDADNLADAIEESPGVVFHSGCFLSTQTSRNFTDAFRGPSSIQS